MSRISDTFGTASQYLGLAKIPSKADLSLPHPQSLVDVSLQGLGAPVDVTHTNFMACGAPLTIGIALDAQPGSRPFCERLNLCFGENGGERRPLGEIGLRFVSKLPIAARELYLFQTTRSTNFCLSQWRRWVQYLHQLRSRRRNRAKNFDVPITEPESRAMAVFYLCPRPLALVSVETPRVRNMFPMNLMGSLGNGYFAFGLNASRAAAPLVESAGRVVLSSVPIDQSSVVSRLGSNHRKASIDWRDLLFALKWLPAICAPVPTFALSVRELQIEAIHTLGSHTLFIGRTIAEETLAAGPQLFQVHGFYFARDRQLFWRSRQPHVKQIS